MTNVIIRAAVAFLIVGFAVGGAHASENVQPKLDVRGFRPRGTVARIKDDLLAVGCTLSKCKVGEGDLVVVESKNLQEPQVRGVRYKFESGTQPAPMIDYVSREYNKQPVPSNRNADIRYAIGHIMEVAFFGTRLVYGGTIARWQLTSDLTLVLYLERPGEVAAYQLWLYSKKIEQAEKDVDAAQLATEHAKKRAVNPTPKF